MDFDFTTGRNTDSGVGLARELTAGAARRCAFCVVKLGKNHCTELRLDRWLWAARFFKTRQLAVTAINRGRVEVDGGRAKPARMIRVGDVLSIRKGPYTYELTIAGLSKQRGSASVAQSLYSESEASRKERERLAQELTTRAAQVFYDPKKPTNRARRQARQWKREQS